MATRTVQDEQEQELEHGDEAHRGLKKLTFKQPLVGRPGKQIGVNDLLTRLKALLDELRTIDQEEAHRDSLMPVAESLAHHSLVQHKDNGVRAWTMCCIVDMLKLFAPDAPYPASKLKDIFSVIILKLLPLLAEPAHPYNSQHMYILRSLAEWKSILLINEIPGSHHLTAALFTTCFDVLSASSSGEELSKNIEHNMTEILSTIIDEAPAVTHDVVDVIVAQFLWADPFTLGTSAKGNKSVQIDAKQSTLRRKEAPPAYNMAKNVCNAFPEKMARLIGNYFSSVIVDFTNSGSTYKPHSKDQGADDLRRGPSEDDINEAHKAHRLLRELWKCCPGVLQEIVPHLQDELATENVQLRQLATETFGDMISGIGAAGPPPLPDMDPAAYPSQSLSRADSSRPFDYLTTPVSINSFPTQYPVAYHSFLQRKNDKSAIIRAAWTTGIGRILMTSAGGIGLDLEEEQKLLKYFSECLIDSDEKVRLAAVKAIAHFDFIDIVRKLGSNGSMAEAGSILSNLADRVKDKKNVIHSESMRLLGKIWGVAAGAIAEGDDSIKALLGPIPSRILEACYVNDLEINVQVDLALYDSLLPLAYPPVKAKAPPAGNSQTGKDSQTSNDQGYTEAGLDKMRTERLLVLVNGLEAKAKKVFFAKQGNQGPDYNGGVTEKGEKDVKTNLEGLITYYAKTLPDPTRVRDDLWKFAKAHDRPSDYRRVEGPGPSVLDTLTPLLYRVSLLCYNKSHGLGATAHELLKEISTKHPKVFSTHVKDLCKTLESEAPTATKPNPPGAVDDLKAYIPMNGRDSQKLVQSFLNFAFYGTPPQAAKHAITIIMNSDDKKEMHAKEILTKSIKGFQYAGAHWLSKLAALNDMDAIVEIAIKEVLQKPHVMTADADIEWMDILVNRLRSLPSDANFNDAAEDTYRLLNRYVKDGGEGSADGNTPAGHKSRQRLLAANSLLKLSCNKRLDAFLSPADFVQLALITHDPCAQGRLPPRFYTILFFLAHEPEKTIKNSTMTWIRARRATFSARKETILETVFARLLSLLAHHPDFDTEDETLKLMAEYILYYLKCIATEENLSLIFHVAQRVKGADENLYILSDLAQALIRKTKLPSEIAKKTWIGEDLVDELDVLPRKKIKGDRSIKNKKAKTERPVKTPKKKRRAGDDDGASDVEGGSDRRSIAHKSYVEVSSDEEGAGEESDASNAEQDKSTPAAEVDKEHGDKAEDSELSDPGSSSEPEPEPAPAKRSTRGKVIQKRKAANLIKEATPPKSARSTTRTKANKDKVNGAAAASSPTSATNGTVRRSGRARG
ncbi:armadillo-type protein [Alternaria rosae]|uniref:armadillo-type protein n=1 Tax=Alternaria rosae TaxID=1187941 RepID=UPI001E8D9223|nr:armadillo-type protein [Alternaria rosae]KAH6842162.1 armadillo-type protein [Alternaria rosae]